MRKKKSFTLKKCSSSTSSYTGIIQHIKLFLFQNTFIDNSFFKKPIAKKSTIFPFVTALS